MLENAIQSFLGLRYESDRKAGSTSCNLISVTKVGTGKAKTGGTGETNCPTLQRKRPLDEIRLSNSMVLGIQNYFQLATCISIDCRKIHRQVMTVLTNRLNTETGCRLVRGRRNDRERKERFGKSAMIRYVSGIDQPIYPIAYIQEQDTDGKERAVCSYTVEGRALIRTDLSMNSSVLSGLRNQQSMGRSTELTDSRISLFSAQRGKCALSGGTL